jgi:hypothetical protein
VHSDHRNVARILPLDLPQLRKNMDAVDSTVRPEVEQDDTPAQLVKGKRVSP